MPISVLPLLLNRTVNTECIAITENCESNFKRNNRVRVKIGLPPLIQPGTTLQFDISFIGGSSSGQIIDNTAKIEDVDDKDVMHYEENDTSDYPQQKSKRIPHEKLKRNRIIKKKIKSKFAGAIVEGEPSLWLESDIDIVSIVDDMKQSNIYVNCLSKHNRCVVDCQ